MKKFTLIFAGFTLVAPLHAQIGGGVDNPGGINGCEDSPENPTAILALVGGPERSVSAGKRAATTIRHLPD